MRWLMALVVMMPALALADVDARFAKMRDVAEKIGGLSEFIDNYAGVCGPLMTAQCEEKRKEFRRGADGKKHYMIVTEDSTNVLSMGDANPITGEFILNMTPSSRRATARSPTERRRRPTRTATRFCRSSAFRRRCPTGGRCS
ncbi:MAG: DUF6066 family protein [Myxococcaceae bacterium]|nr:DUF6066 family protein [Myxococcaceae bacterium]